MSPDQLEQIKEVFYAAMEQSVERRAEFLAEACAGDLAARAEVERLLREHDQADGFLEAPLNVIASDPPVSGPQDDRRTEETPVVSEFLIGKTVSHYRVLGMVGSGGMGVVYRARDIRLGRLAALKFLPDDLIASSQVLQRFELEARAASSLNHPNICTIYEVEEYQGRPFIVMELLEGRTLREYLQSLNPENRHSKASSIGSESPPPHGSRLAIDELLDLAIQIAEGLDVAHRQGIIHRDIKPANIFITTSGQAKILDFGLAKSTRVEVSGARPSDEAHSTCGASLDLGSLILPSAMMGTAAYMSPEQIRGENLDVRTDLFSFGLVLYEMATGKPAFRGETIAAVHEAILRAAPATPREAGFDRSPGLEKIISRALVKDREMRYQSARDLGEDLERLKRETESVRGRLRHPVLAAVAAVVIIVGALGFLFRPTLPAPRVTASTQVTHDGRDKERVVTDGSRLYYSSYLDLNPRLYQVSAAGGDPLLVETSIPSPLVFDMSRHGSELLVGSCYSGRTTSDCPLWVLPVAGGSPRRLGTIGASDAAWSPDGKQVAYVAGNNLYTVAIGRFESETIVSGASGATLYWPRWSPDGSRLRFSITSQSNGTSLWEVSADGKNLHRLLSGWSTPPSECCGSWTDDGGYFLFQSDRGGNTNVWVMRERRSVFGKSSGQPVQLTAGPSSAGTAVPSTDNRKLFVTTARLGELVRYDSVSHEFAPYLSGISATGVSFSRDGQWVTYVSYPQHTLWRSKTDGSERLQLTFPPLYVLQPRWSPDRKRIAFMALQPEKPWNIYVISADGGGLEQPVPGDHRGQDPNWSPDGNKLLFGRRPSEEAIGSGSLELEIVDLRTHITSKIAGSKEMWSPRWSQDGRWILAFPRATDRLMLFDVNRQEWTELAKIHASYPEWSRDGHHIYFLAQSKGTPATAIFRVRIRDRRLEQVARLTQFKQPTVDWGGWAGLAADGSPILLREAGTPEIFALDWDAP
jgi:serine/threonine protein kinase